MKLIYFLGLIGLVQAMPGMPPLPPRALHKVYDLHPREHSVLEPRQDYLNPRDEPNDAGPAGILETMETTISLMGTSIRANAELIKKTANTVANTTAGPGTNQLLLTGENLIEASVNNMALSIQHATSHIQVTSQATESGLIGVSRQLSQRDINKLSTGLQELTSLLGIIRDLVSLTIQQLPPPVKQVIRPDVNVLEAAIGPLVQPIRVLIVSIINVNKGNPEVDTTLLNGVPETVESILDAIVNNRI